MKVSHLKIAVVAAIVTFGTGGAVEKTMAGMGYYDLFAVGLSPTDFHWNQISGTPGMLLNDPLVSPDPNGFAITDSSTSLGGVVYAFGGHDYHGGSAGTEESDTSTGNSISLSGQSKYYLSVVLDSATAPFRDEGYPSWGTVSNIAITQHLSGGGTSNYFPSEADWEIAPFDPNLASQIVFLDPTSQFPWSVALDPSSVDAAEDDLQAQRVFGAGLELPTRADITGYTVTFDTDLHTWDAYSLTATGGKPPVPGVGPPITQLGAVSHPYNVLPKPENVPGKELSNNLDKDSLGVADALQNVAFDCQGGCSDAYDYSGSAFGGNLNPNENDQVDAIANASDAYFWPMTQDKVPMLLSFRGTQGGTDGDIMYQMAEANPKVGTWATAQTILPSPATPDDVDGLEVYGPSDDANMFSLDNDPATTAFPGGVAMWQYHPNPFGTGPVSLPYISTAALKAAMGVGGEFPDQTIDLDALMVYERENEWQGTAGFTFGPDDAIVFSVEANQQAGGSFDGGEVWVWEFGAPAQFLVHGGEVWDTLHDVGAHFGVGTEEVNALEAVAAIPEPATPGLLVLGGLATLIGRRRISD